MEHALCDKCWEKIRPGRTPVKMLDPAEEKCCACGETHKSGIFVRGFPSEFPKCQGHG